MRAYPFNAQEGATADRRCITGGPKVQREVKARAAATRRAQ
ncbi:hypothetical protein C7S17_2646 [Burkholderia thailandensis]|nr:hypothetical protein [Burkholderia thailandensis]